jgi:hypothetical protein
MSASETFLPPRLPLLNAAWMPLQRLQHLRELGPVVDFPVLLRREPDARARCAAALVAAAEVEDESKAVDASCEGR